ncbi:MAG: guanylate kinase [Candidatus Omnitrophica bacterium]|nr:guanylate kinase [Candidatus Omnitrophota bacterium]
MKKKQGIIFIITGPSGSGKTTLRSRLLEDKKLRKILTKSISFTTRAKRSGEKNGRDYYFLNESKFLALRRAKKILEWTKYLGYYYGTPKDYVEKSVKAGRNVVLCTDLKGVANIKRLYPLHSISIFVRPPSLKTLETRMKGRCRRIPQNELKRRIELAREELRHASSCDYQILNNKLPEALAQLKHIITQQINKKT